MGSSKHVYRVFVRDRGGPWVPAAFLSVDRREAIRPRSYRRYDGPKAAWHRRPRQTTSRSHGTTLTFQTLTFQRTPCLFSYKSLLVHSKPWLKITSALVVCSPKKRFLFRRSAISGSKHGKTTFSCVRRREAPIPRTADAGKDAFIINSDWTTPGVAPQFLALASPEARLAHCDRRAFASPRHCAFLGTFRMRVAHRGGDPVGMHAHLALFAHAGNHEPPVTLLLACF